MEATNFYKNLTLITDFCDITNDTYYKKVPSDWYVLVSDIKGSTKAIEQGMYKHVNFVAALVIIGILNIRKDLDLPFVFGGDGATVLIPPSMLEKSKKVLLDAALKAKNSFDLNLRVGVVPVIECERRNTLIQIAKYSISPDHTQAVIKGNGLELAENLLKTNQEEFEVKKDYSCNYNSDFDGLECRWQDIPSPKEETISILVKTLQDSSSSNEIYKDVILNIEKIAGIENERHPIKESSNLNLSFNPMILNAEASILSNSFFSKLKNFFLIFTENLIGKYLMSKKDTIWGDYKNRILRTTDTEKFDDMLRMVITVNKIQTKQLEDYLEKHFINKNLVYGIHKSNSALMTCLIFERHGRHIHFVDSSNGGYAIAAKYMKDKIKNL